jgi:hypothetical protein
MTTTIDSININPNELVDNSTHNNTLFIIKKSIFEYLLTPIAIFGFLFGASIAVYLKLLFYNSYLSIKFLPVNLGELKYWVYGATIMMFIYMVSMYYSYFKSNIALEVTNTNILINAKSLNLSNIHSIKTIKVNNGEGIKLALEVMYKSPDFESKALCFQHIIEYSNLTKKEFNLNLEPMTKHFESYGIKVDLLSM